MVGKNPGLKKLRIGFFGFPAVCFLLPPLDETTSPIKRRCLAHGLVVGQDVFGGQVATG